MMHKKRFRIAKCTETCHNLFLVDFLEECAEYPIPNRQDSTVIGISLQDDYRMVDAVHRRGHEEKPEDALESCRRLQAAVLKLCRKDQSALEENHRDDLCTK